MLLVWLLQHPLPGMLRALAYSEREGQPHAVAWLGCRSAVCGAAQPGPLPLQHHATPTWTPPACSWHSCCPLPGLALYALLSLIMDGPASLAIGLTGLRVSPHFDQPWMATTVASFWSKRWDLAAGGPRRPAGRARATAGLRARCAVLCCAPAAACLPARVHGLVMNKTCSDCPALLLAVHTPTGNTLRQLIFDSVCEGRLQALPRGSPLRQPPPGRKLLGSTAAFAASGLIHECIFWWVPAWVRASSGRAEVIISKLSLIPSKFTLTMKRQMKWRAAILQAALQHPCPSPRCGPAECPAPLCVHPCSYRPFQPARYLTGHTTHGVWLSFFLAQVPLTVFERLALGALKRRGIILPDRLRALVGARSTFHALETAEAEGQLCKRRLCLLPRQTGCQQSCAFPALLSKASRHARSSPRSLPRPSGPWSFCVCITYTECTYVLWQAGCHASHPTPACRPLLRAGNHQPAAAHRLPALLEALRAVWRGCLCCGKREGRPAGRSQGAGFQPGLTCCWHAATTCRRPCSDRPISLTWMSWELKSLPAWLDLYHLPLLALTLAGAAMHTYVECLVLLA